MPAHAGRKPTLTGKPKAASVKPSLTGIPKAKIASKGRVKARTPSRFHI